MMRFDVGYSHEERLVFVTHIKEIQRHIGDAVGSVTGGGVGRGASLTIIFSGIGLSVIALMTVRVKRLYTLENSEAVVAQI